MYSKLFFSGVFLMSLCVHVFAQDKKHITDKTHDLQEVVVTATGTRHLLKNTPVHTEVITRRMLDAYAGKSIEDILSGLTASLAFNESDMGSQMQMGGLGNSYILILLDGKRLHGDNGGDNDLGLIDPHNIERIEIVKGAQSALYGSDAIAGVINIITKKHTDKGIALENTTRYGTYNDIRQHNGIAVGIGKVQSYTNFQFQHNDGWQNTSIEESEGNQIFTDSRNKTSSRFSNFQIAERITYTPSANTELYASGTYYWKRIYRPTGQGKSFDTYFYDLMYHNNSASVGGKLKLSGTDQITFDVDWNQHAYYHTVISDKYFGEGYNQFGEFVTDYPYFKNQDLLQSDQQRVMAQTKGVFTLPHSNVLSAGIEYRYDYLKAPLRVSGGKADDWTAAVYVQDEYNPLKWLNITAGLRLNQNDAFGFRATPKISSMVSLGDFRIRLNWGLGFKTPTPKELYYKYLKTMGGNLYYYMGNDKLKAQSSSYWSANVEYRNKRFSASLTGSYNVLSNMITLVTVSEKEMPSEVLTEYWGLAPVARKYMNMESAKTYGVDVNLSYSPTKELTASASYSFLNTDAKVYDTETEQLVNVTIDGMAHHRSTLLVNYNHQFTNSYKLGIGFNMLTSSKRYYQIDGDGKGYCICRLNTTHDFGGNKSTSFKLDLGIDNIFDYKDTTMRPYHLGTNTAGRTFYVSMNIRFKSGIKLNTNNIKNRSNNERNEED